MPKFHYFGAPGDLARTVSEIAERHSYEMVFRTSTRQVPPELGEGKHVVEGQTWLVFNDLHEAIASGPPAGSEDIALSISSPWVFDNKTISLWGERFLNVHYSLLPKYRGGGGQTWQTLAGERWRGVTLHQLIPAIDAGPIIARKKLWQTDSAAPEELASKLEKLAQSLLIKNLPLVMKRSHRLMEQKRGKHSYWPRLNSKVQGFIDWSWAAGEIVVFCDAFRASGTYALTEIQNNVVEIESAVRGKKRYFHPFTWGLVFYQSEFGLYVASKGGEVVITLRSSTNDQPRNLEGERFFTSSLHLDSARSSRPRLKPSGEWIIRNGTNSATRSTSLPD